MAPTSFVRFTKSDINSISDLLDNSLLSKGNEYQVNGSERKSSGDHSENQPREHRIEDTQYARQISKVNGFAKFCVSRGLRLFELAGILRWKGDQGLKVFFKEEREVIKLISFDC